MTEGLEQAQEALRAAAAQVDEWRTKVAAIEAEQAQAARQQQAGARQLHQIEEVKNMFAEADRLQKQAEEQEAARNTPVRDE